MKSIKNSRVLLTYSSCFVPIDIVNKEITAENFNLEIRAAIINTMGNYSAYVNLLWV